MDLAEWCARRPADWPDLGALPQEMPGWSTEQIGALRVFDRPALQTERLRVCVWALAHPDEPPGVAAALALLRAPGVLPHVHFSVCLAVDGHAAQNAGWAAAPTLERYVRGRWRPSSEQDVEQGLPVDRFPLLHSDPLPRAADLARWLTDRAPGLAVALHADALAGDHVYSSAQPPAALQAAWRAVSARVGCVVHAGLPLSSAAQAAATDVFAEPTLATWLAGARARHGRLGEQIVRGPVPVSVFLQTLPQPARTLTLETGLWQVPGLDDRRPARASVRAAARATLGVMDTLGRGDLPDWPLRRRWLRGLDGTACTVAQVASLRRLHLLSLWCAGEAINAGTPGAEAVLEELLGQAGDIVLADPQAGARSLLGRLLVTCAALS